MTSLLPRLSTGAIPAEVEQIRRLVSSPKMPPSIARLAELPAGSPVVHVSTPARQRRLDGLFFDRGQNTWLAKLDGSTTCQPRDLRLPGDQLDLLAPCESGRAWA
ncbi:hypothetical protein [Azotobacter beijerinckii]|uniref:Uncharacterized protein n=1 Tax=Azotobacter beijerinckii TaxID=170623 RepID=A0A1I3ZPP2_9GAMM|nr:hypothetical protein [Azotobacter beijerinckii]SFK45880.1 hypothetical protein SAMN04244574_00693 [Azotobacter beijerinckii]